MADIQSVRQKAADSVSALRQLMAGLGLDDNIGMWHEFVPHAASNIQQIRDTAAAVDRLPKSDPEFYGFALTVGSALSSIGDVKEAERFIAEARKKAPNADQRAFSGYSLFWVRLRLEQFDDALDVLMTAIRHDPKRYSLLDATKYRPMKIVGAGALGIVFQCENPDGGRPVLVKSLWEPYPGMGTQAFEDIERLRQLNDPAIVLPKEMGFALPETQERPYFVYDRVLGISSGEEWLAQNRQMSAEQAMALGSQILRILGAAHSVGVAHWDLKPGTLWFKQAGTGFDVLVSDFGLMRAGAHLRTRALSQPDPSTKSFIGRKALESLDYMAPELKSGGQSGFAADFYGFGSLMYRFFSGEVPKETSGTKLPNMAGLYQLLLTCREDNPSKRPPTAAGLAQWWADPSRGPEAAGIASGVGTARVADPFTGAVADGPMEGAAASKSKLPLFIGVGVGAAVILAVVLVFALGGGKKEKEGDKKTGPAEAKPEITDNEARAITEWYDGARSKVFDYLRGHCTPLHEAGYRYESHLKAEKRSKTVNNKISEYTELVLELRPKGSASGDLDVFECVNQVAKIQKDHPIVYDLRIRFYQAGPFAPSQHLAVFTVEGPQTGYLSKKRFDSAAAYKGFFALPGLSASGDEGLRIFARGQPAKIDAEGIHFRNILFKRKSDGAGIDGHYVAEVKTDKLKRDVNDWASGCKSALTGELSKLSTPSGEHKRHQEFFSAAKDWVGGFCDGLDKLNAAMEPYSDAGVAAALEQVQKARTAWNTNIHQSVQKLLKSVGRDLKAPAF